MAPDEIDAGSDRLIGRLIGGKFRLRACIGVGSSGAVYRADQVALGRTVAVKVLRPDSASDPRLVRRFHDEALAASRLNHPNTVSVIDYGQTEDGLLYIVMEFLRGRTLSDLLRDEFPLDPARLVNIFCQILSGLDEAHEAGVVHADLKSDNVMVEQRRGGDLAKVVDFGISRLVGAPKQAQFERTISGTPEYMAPELIAGADPTYASDLYAAGVVLYEMLAGTTPFGTGSSLVILTRHLRETPSPPSQRRPDVSIPEALEVAAMRALSKRPGERFDSAAEFHDVVSQGLGPKSERTGEQALCAGCGVLTAAAFKFCPECGMPREVRRTRDMPSSLVPARVTRTDPSIVPPPGARHADALANTALMPASALEPAPVGLDEMTTATRGLVAAGDAAAIAASVEPRGAAAASAPRRTAPPQPAHEMPAPAPGILPLPLFGRSAQLEQLVGFFRGDDGVPVLQLVGESGMGRTRLMREASAQVANDGGTVIILAGADPTGMAAPFYPIRGVVAAVLDLPPVCPYDALGAALEQLGLTRRDLPGIGELFGHAGEARQLEPPVRRRELMASTLRVLGAAARHRAAALVFEDVDQYDAPSQEILRRLAERPDGAVRVLVTTQPELADRWSGVPRLDLPPLDSAALREVAEHLQQARGRMPDADQLAARTGGSPAHIDQLARYVVEGGDLDAAPSGVADLMAARLALLPRNAQAVCQAAAVLGRESSRDILAELCGRELGSDGLADGLSLLEARGIARIEVDIVAFERGLVREVAYEAIPVHVRRDLDTAVLKVLAGTPTSSAVLGHHHELAGNLHDAADLLSAAGDEAVHQHDDLGASRLYNRAMNAARRLLLADDDAKLRSLFVSVAVKLAEALRVGGEVALARGVLEEARAHCEGAKVLLAQLLRAQSHLLQSEGSAAAALAVAREGIGLSITTGQIDLLCELYLDIASVHLRSGDVPQAVSELEEGINLVTLGDGGRARGGPQSLWRLLLRLSQLYDSAGRQRDAIATGEDALRHALRVGSRLGSARTQSLLAHLYDGAGNQPKADRCRREAVAEMRRLGDRRGTAELLLAGTSPTTTMLRISPVAIREARELADEIGWTEGAELARRSLH